MIGRSRESDGAGNQTESAIGNRTEAAIDNWTMMDWQPDGARDEVGNRNRMTTELATGGNRKEPAIDNCTATEQKPDMDQTDRMGDGRDGRMIGSCGELK